MTLKGQARRDWQRAYMRKRRLDPVIQESERESQRIRGAIRRAKLKALKALEPSVTKELLTRGECEICGFSLTIDIHHEEESREVHILCPNHHALITRGIKTLEELREFTPLTLKPVTPKVDADGNILYDF